MIHKIIDEKIDIHKMLVVTFTNAAAAEMRQRVLDAIYQKLEENPDDEHLRRQITLLNMASICTIDSFCLDIVKSHFYELEQVSPNFRIADTAEIDLLKEEILENIFEEKYQKEDADFTSLIHTYTTYRDDTPLKDLVKKVYTYITSTPFPKVWLHKAVEMFNLQEQDGLDKDFKETVWGKELLWQLQEEIEDDVLILEEVKKKVAGNKELEPYWQTLQSDIEQMQQLKNSLGAWDTAFETSQHIRLNDWPRKRNFVSKEKDEAKAVRDIVKDKFNAKRNKLLIVDSKQASQDVQDMYQILKRLEAFVLEFDTQFSKAKRERNIVDFTDIEHFALRILENQEISKSYADKFEEIAIDEYQDSNEVQEYILTAISRGNNMFMVGDVKQSIYKFRQAMPELFLKKYKTYQKQGEKAEGVKIQLFKNFRSRKNVLDFTNLVFENMMSETLGDVDYTEDEYLNLGATDYQENGQNLKTEIHVLHTEGGENAIETIQEEEGDEEDEPQEQEFLEDIDIEARYIADKIEGLIQSNYQVYDRKMQTFRKIQPRDIVILLRSTKNKAGIYEQELMKRNLPVFSDSTQEYLDTIEIETIMNLLKIIDNPIQDIPLVTVLRSPIGGFSDDDLVNIRLSDKQCHFYECMQKAKINVTPELKEKIQTFLVQLETWRKEQEYLALDEFIWKIYIDTGYYNYVGLMPNGIQRQANLKILFERAKQYESASFKGLYHFINFIEKLRMTSGDMGAAKIIGENDDVIRIMSIHKSKGLEFPVVFLANANKQFNKQDIRNDSVLLHQTYGIGAKYINYEMQIRYDTLAREAVKTKIEIENLAEEMRILYVALTRAKEKIFITVAGKTVRDKMEQLQKQVEIYPKENGKINPILLKKCQSYFEWIWLVYLYNQEEMKSIVDCHIMEKEALDNMLQKEGASKDTIGLEERLGLTAYVSNETMAQEIHHMLEYQYSHIEATKLPTKMSVSDIKKGGLSLGTQSMEVTLAKPAFLQEDERQELTGAQKGTAMHLCMQNLDLHTVYDEEKLKEFIHRLAQEQILSEKEKESIKVEKLLRFTQSSIWQELQHAKVVEREKPFYMQMPAKEIYQEEVEGDILVQGIIDLYYINQKDELVLLDYKTDYAQNVSELVEKYRSQLTIYQKALEESLQRKVDRVLIYSTFFDSSCQV